MRYESKDNAQITAITKSHLKYLTLFSATLDILENVELAVVRFDLTAADVAEAEERLLVRWLLRNMFSMLRNSFWIQRKNKRSERNACNCIAVSNLPMPYRQKKAIWRMQHAQEIFEW